MFLASSFVRNVIPLLSRTNLHGIVLVVDFQQVWDDEVAARAQEFTEVCHGGHGMLRE